MPSMARRSFHVPKEGESAPGSQKTLRQPPKFEGSCVTFLKKTLKNK